MDTVTNGPSSFNPGDIAWTLMSTAMVWLMIPGVGFLYCGMARSKSALSLLTLCVWSTAVVSVQWFLFGYSLVFSSHGNAFIGWIDKGLLLNVIGSPSEINPRIPEILFAIYEGMFAAITPALIIGSTAERGRFLPTILFMFLWTTFVYDFVAYWVWGPHGWYLKLGGLDFAGGLPVHLASGVSATVFAWLLEEREESVKDAKPHNIVQVILGTSLIWFGYFGFNGGSAQGANTRAAIVVCNTNLSASIGGITWAVIDYVKDKKFSSLSLCFGAISGLVTVTAASGFITPACSIVFGVLGAVGCRGSVQLKNLFSVDDALDVFAIHGMGGFIGTIITGIFATNSIATLDGMSSIDGGLIDGGSGRWIQILYQVAGCSATIAWSALITFAILFIMNRTPGLKLRADSRECGAGLDCSQLGESAYDYAHLKQATPPERFPLVGRRRSSISAALHHLKLLALSEEE